MTAPISPGSRLGRYEIKSHLGTGGMGEVYLARDTTELKRTVAIKVLPAQFASDTESMQRFIREAQTASSLNHPNIITIFEIGEADGSRFIVTEFIDGETLQERIARTRIEIDEAIDITIQVAIALAAAHKAKILHRDIKPANIMVRRDDGIVKLLDFGLAKPTAHPPEQGSPDSQDLTQTLLKTSPGIVLGTVAYMSPEQGRGVEVDERTDIWSLGCVLYEMLAGCLPFMATTTNEMLIVLQSKDKAPPLLRYADDVPDRLEEIVTKALAKNRDQRYQSFNDMLVDLKRFKRSREDGVESERDTRAGRSQSASTVTVIDHVSQDAKTVGTQLGARSTVHPSSSAEYIVSKISIHKRAAAITLAAIVLAAIALSYFFYFKNRAPALTDQDTILIADFDNKTGDPVFDLTLKQALAVQLGQSPFLNIFGEERVRETLRLMNRSPDERVTPVIGREICQRQGLKAMLTGSIASLGRNYVISLEAVNTQTGETLAREQGEAEGKEQVLRSLGEAATRLREKLGESLSSIQKFDAPIVQGTTSSLEALKAFSLGIEQNRKGKFFEAIASLKHAVELDPNFARAYSLLAVNYGNTSQPGLAAEAAQRAFELRERVSERERLNIADQYYSIVTGELNKAIEALELCAQTYPRDEEARHNLGFAYNLIGQHEKAVEAYREVLRLNPNLGISRANLSNTFVRLNRFEEARAMSDQTIALKFDSVSFRRNLYHLAFIHGDASAMKQQVDWASARPGEYAHLNWQAGAAAFVGQWQKAQDFSNRAAELALQRNFKEEAGDSMSSNAEWAALFGHCGQRGPNLARAAALPRIPLSFFRAGMSLALCGDVAQAQTLNDEAVKRYPKFTLVNEIYLPLIRAAIEIQDSNQAQTIQKLQAASRYESVTFFYSNYLHGQAWLAERKGAEAASEFRKILDHRGWAPLSPLFPLAHLGLARAAVLQGDISKAQRSYQDFFALWKDADADLPILIEAKKEYEKVK
jgi:serine/threonine protein kinase/Flp pilus assembly protein TadD